MDPYEFAITVGEQAGIHLEVVNGIPVWEAFPSFRHQRLVDRIRATISPTSMDGNRCECVHASDVYIRFSDGSLKRPDISIFCREPDELDNAITLQPEAIIEIISKGFAAKDMEIGVPFYLRMGVKDILVYDPETNKVTHLRPDQPEAIHESPMAFTLACGCTVTV
jgi:Uma2 family endonuclease